METIPRREGDLLTKAFELLESNGPVEHCLNHGFSSLLFVGTPFSGKSTLIERYIADKSDLDPADKLSSKKVTFGLRQYYAHNRAIYRFNNASSDSNNNNSNSNIGGSGGGSLLDKRTCFIWELSNGWLYPGLIEIALTPDCLQSSSIVLTIDLTKPNEMIHLMNTIISDINSYLSKQKTSQNVPILVLGTKYDEFKDMEPEVKKQIVILLRAFCVRFIAQLLFVSSKSETLTKRLENWLNFLAFNRFDNDVEITGNGSKPSSISTNPSKPVMIPFGYDSYTKIGITSYEDTVQNFVRIFPQQPINFRYKNVFETDPIYDQNFVETEIDKVFKYKTDILKKGQKNEQTTNGRKNEKKNNKTLSQDSFLEEYEDENYDDLDVNI